MNISSFKNVVDTLARYAESRAPDGDPRSKIGVQVSSGRLTLIAGSCEGGILYRVKDASCGDNALFAIDAKMLIQAAKVLKGKGTLNIIAGDDWLDINVSGGGSVTLQAVCELKDAGFVPKPKRIDSRINISADQWEQLYRILPSIDQLDSEPPVISVDDDNVNIVAVAKGMRPCYARFQAKSSECVTKNAATFISFWESLKTLESDGYIGWGSDGVIAESGDIACWGKPMLFGGYNVTTGEHGKGEYPASWPILAATGPTTAYFTMNRTSLIEAIRGVAPSSDKDEYGRITIEIEQNKITLTPFGDEYGISLPTVASGKAIRSVRADFMVRMLRASVGKEVTIGVYKSPPLVISSPEMRGWTLLVAPVAFG